MEELQADALQQREKIHAMQRDLEAMEKRILRTTKAAKQLQKAHQIMRAAAVEFHDSLIPFASDRDDHVLVQFARVLQKVTESEANLGERLGPMILDPLNRFAEMEVRPGLDAHSKMIRAREAYDAKQKTPSLLKRDASRGAEEEKKREFDEANLRYVQKLIDVETKKEFEIMDIFANWVVCSLTHHKRAWKLLDEMQPMIKAHKKKNLLDSKQYTAEEEARTAVVKQTLEKTGSQSDFQGYLTSSSVIGKPRRFWIVANGILAQYRKYSDFSPVESYDLLLFTVKPVPEDPAAFCLVSPTDNMVLQAGSPEEKVQWMSAIAASISNQLNCQQLTSSGGGGAGGGGSGLSTSGSGNRVNTSDPAHPLQRIRRGNSSFLKCVDCGAPDPDWGAINLGILFCIHCSGIHRNLGVHISQVRSLTLDVDVWDGDLVRMMTGVGNATSNSIWEANYSGLPVRPSSSGGDMKNRETFILAKYRDRAFVSRSSADARTLMDLCTGEDPPSVVELLARFAAGDPLNQTNERGQNVLHFLVQQADALVLLEFCCRNDPSLVLQADQSGNTPMAIAVRARSFKASSILARHGAEKSSWKRTSQESGAASESLTASSGAAPSLTFSPEQRRRGWTSTTPRAGLKPPQVSARLSVAVIQTPTLLERSPSTSPRSMDHHSVNNSVPTTPLRSKALPLPPAKQLPSTPVEGEDEEQEDLDSSTVSWRHRPLPSPNEEE